MQKDFESLTTEWVAVSDIITVEDDVRYYIQNRGADRLIGQEGIAKPADDNQAGLLVLPYDTAEYIKGSEELYLRAFDKECSINISSEE